MLQAHKDSNVLPVIKDIKGATFALRGCRATLTPNIKKVSESGYFAKQKVMSPSDIVKGINTFTEAAKANLEIKDEPSPLMEKKLLFKKRSASKGNRQPPKLDDLLSEFKESDIAEDDDQIVLNRTITNRASGFMSTNKGKAKMPFNE